MSSYPLVTLAIFTYNQARFISEAIESALAQSYTPLEILISDDCSTDSTFDIANEIASRYEGCHRIVINRNACNLGIAGNINAVLAIARGEIICWSGGDDVSLPDKIQSLVMPLIAEKSLSATHSYVNEIDEESKFIRLRKPVVPSLISSPEQVIENALEIISQSHAFRRSAFSCFGPIDKSVTNEGAIMAFREACMGKILLIEKPLTNYRIGTGTSTQRGKTISELSITEPTKYANWWASAYKQISKDAKLVELPEDLKELIRRRSRIYDLIFQVNAIPMNFLALHAAAFSYGFTNVLKAFVRRNTPHIILRWVYRYRGWLM